MKIKKFNDVDAANLVNYGVIGFDGLSTYERVARILTMRDRELTYSAFYMDRVICIGGLSLYWKGVGEFWAVYNKDVVMNLKLCLSASRAVVRQIIQDNDIHRAHAVCLDNEKHIKFTEIIGFTRVCKLRKYTENQEDSILFEWVKQ